MFRFLLLAATAVSATALQFPCSYPVCNGTWTCPDSNPVFHPQYGMICGTGTVLRGDVCPLGGVIVGSVCSVQKPMASWGCPDMHSDSMCTYEYPAYCPRQHVYIPEQQGCVGFSLADCRPPCDTYVCPYNSTLFHYNNTAVCILERVPAVANDSGFLGCPDGMVLH